VALTPYLPITDELRNEIIEGLIRRLSRLLLIVGFVVMTLGI